MCCASQVSVPGTVDDFNNSPTIAAIKDTLKKGGQPNACHSCIQIEKGEGVSLRQESLNEYNFNADNVPDEVTYLDLRYSNLCNFSCRTCSPEFSSKLDDEAQVLPAWFRPANKKVNHDVLSYVTPEITKINFTGGEPLLIKENLEILQSLLARGALDTHISITTNCSALNHKIINIVKQFHDIHWTLSIDAVGTAAEYIRNGTNWTLIDRNVTEILSWGHSVAFNVTLSAYSILVLDKLADWVITKFKHSTGPCELWFHVCQYPLYLSPEALGDQLRTLAIKQITSTINKLSGFREHLNQTFNTLHAVLFSLNNPLNEYLTQKFINFTYDLDRVRDQNFDNTFNGY